MLQALEFLRNHKEVAFATSESHLPKLHIFQILKQECNVLYFATSQEKAVYRELVKNPNCHNSRSSENPLGFAAWLVQEHACIDSSEREEVRPKVKEGGEVLDPIKVLRADIDYNKHVNNANYVRMAMELLPENFKIQGLRVEYRVAAKLGDVPIPTVYKNQRNKSLSSLYSRHRDAAGHDIRNLRTCKSYGLAYWRQGHRVE